MINSDGTKVRITIRNLQKDVEPEPSLAVYEGLLRGAGERVILIYEEQVEGQSIRNRLTFSAKELVIRKSGAVTGSLVYREGCRISTQYSLGFTVIQIENDTSRVVFEKTENGLTAEIDYRLTINGSFITRSELKIIAEPI